MDKTTVSKYPRSWDARGNSHGWFERGYFITLALLKEAAGVAL